MVFYTENSYILFVSIYAFLASEESRNTLFIINRPTTWKERIISIRSAEMVNKPRRCIHVLWLCPLATTFKDLLFLPTFFCFYPFFSWWTPIFWYERHSLVFWGINTSPETQLTSRTSNIKLHYQNIKAHGFVVSFDVFQSADRIICSQHPPFSPLSSDFTIVATSTDRKCKYARRIRYLCTKRRITFRRTVAVMPIKGISLPI